MIVSSYQPYQPYWPYLTYHPYLSQPESDAVGGGGAVIN